MPFWQAAGAGISAMAVIGWCPWDMSMAGIDIDAWCSQARVCISDLEIAGAINTMTIASSASHAPDLRMTLRPYKKHPPHGL